MFVRRLILALVAMCACKQTPDPAPEPAAAAVAPDRAVAVAAVLGAAPLPDHGLADFAVNPTLGIPTGKRHLLVFFATDAEGDAISTAIADAGVTIAGSAPELRYAVVTIPADGSWDTLERARAALAAHPAVAAVTHDLLLSSTIMPAQSSVLRTPGPLPNRTQHSPQGTPGDWWLPAIGAPQAWNAVPALRWLHARAPRRVEVGFVEALFPDPLPADLAGAMHVLPDDSDGEMRGQHGVNTTGLVGALWNGQQINGLVPDPLVHVTGARGGSGGVFHPRTDIHITNIGGAWRAAIDKLAAASPPVRLINISLGFNWFNTNFATFIDDQVSGDVAICDPRPSNTQPGSFCDATAVRAAIAGSGAAFRTLTARLNVRRRVLFIVSAGNDAWSWGLFPADLASPAAQAGLALGDPNVLVVGSHSFVTTTTAPLIEFLGSNRGAHILAPGVDIETLSGDHTSLEVGTSIAAPIVTGAAAYLLALDPDLSNPELRRLLQVNQVEVTDPLSKARAVRPVLNLRRSVEAMQVKLPDGSRVRGSKLLADLDDGTADGFTRDRPPPPRTWDRVVVDMKDVRAFRDAGWLTRMGVPLLCPSTVPRCDLNENGSFTVPVEPHARAALLGSEVDDAAMMQLISEWDGDPVQPFTRLDLPALLHSADLHVDADAFLRRAGAAKLELTLSGERPVEATTQLAGTTGVQDIPVAMGGQIVTTPYLPTTNLRVVVGDRTFIAAVEDLGLAEDRRIVLNPCALVDPAIGLLAPYPSDLCPGDPGIGKPIAALWSIHPERNVAEDAAGGSSPLAIGLDGTITSLGHQLRRDNMFGVEAGRGRVFFAGTNHIVQASTGSAAVTAVADTTNLTDIVLHGGSLIVVRGDTIEARAVDSLAVVRSHTEPFAVYDSACVVGDRLYVTGVYREDRTFKHGVTLYDVGSLTMQGTVAVPGKGAAHAACTATHAWVAEFTGDRTFRVGPGDVVAVATPRARRVFAAGDRVWVTTNREQTHIIATDTLNVTTIDIAANSVAFRPDGATGWINTGRALVETDQGGTRGATIPVDRALNWLAYSGD
jgi:hypothetical protein